MESEQATPVVSIKDVVRSSVKVPEFDKHLKKIETIKLCRNNSILVGKELVLLKMKLPTNYSHRNHICI